MPGTRNPLSLSHIVDKIEGAVQHTRTTVSPHTTKPSLDQTLAAQGLEIPYVDLQIQFIGASGLPKMDVVGSADPYFVANLDGKLSFVSTVKQNTLSPVWNEIWHVKNVPSTANLQVEVMDKDEGVTDDYFGKFSVSVTPGTKEVEIEGTVFKIARGTFWIKIESTPSQDKRRLQFPYLFDGPIRYSRHYSPTVGRLTNLNDARLYSTWKIFLTGVPLFFRDTFQPWNRNYKATQSIFQGGPASLAVRSGIQAGHRVLYARTADNAFGIIEDSNGVLELLHTGSQDDVGPIAQRVKPAVYTYIISAEDDSFRFSETGAAFFVDFASKHALHSNCAEVVRYSGEFHPRPEGGWQNFNDATPDDAVKWEFVIDNNSGTYAPDKMLLPEVKELFEYNFPGLVVLAMDREDERLVESREACRAYALKWRGVKTDELEPHVKVGEVTLCRRVSESGQQEPEARRPEDNFTNLYANCFFVAVFMLTEHGTRTNFLCLKEWTSDGSNLDSHIHNPLAIVNVRGCERSPSLPRNKRGPMSSKR